jgi:hypothetical protein
MTRHLAVAVQQGDTVTGTEPAFEIGGQLYAAGDRVRFPRAATRKDRARIYEITEAGVDGITVEVDGCRYQISGGDIDVIGITHAEECT